MRGSLELIEKNFWKVEARYNSIFYETFDRGAYVLHWRNKSHGTSDIFKCTWDQTIQILIRPRVNFYNMLFVHCLVRCKSQTIQKMSYVWETLLTPLAQEQNNEGRDLVGVFPCLSHCESLIWDKRIQGPCFCCHE